MELRKLKPTYEVIGMICDMCNNSCAKKIEFEENKEYNYEYGTLSASWGYWSDGKDLTREECHICEKCFDKVREFILSQGGKIRSIELSSFESTGPSYCKRKGIDYDELSGMVIYPYLRKKLVNELDQIKLDLQAQIVEDKKREEELHQIMEEEAKKENENEKE